MPIPESPQTREEQYLNAIATGDSSGIPDAPVTREEMYLDAIAKGGGGGVPSVTTDDIGKSLMVQEVKHYTTIVPAQTITIPAAADPENPQPLIIELNAENTSLFASGATLHFEGEDHLGSEVCDKEAEYVDEDPEWAGVWFSPNEVWMSIWKSDADGKVYFVSQESGGEAYQVTFFLGKEAPSTAEWGKQYPVMIAKGTQDADTGVYTFDKTFNEVVSALRIMPVIFIINYDEDNPNYPYQYFADYAEERNDKYCIHLINTSGDEFMSDTEDGYLTWNPG